MPISRGSRLGAYEITAPLGAGGMGEVYRARDTRLGRDVAIKVLPAELSADPARLSRFETEARAASALNHPNIVTIYEIGRQDAVSYIAMELVDGKTLRELSSPTVPTKKLLPIAAQAASGLAKAHAAGIVHRDLKPENVMVTGDGVVKILDFGLAKLAPTVSELGQSEAATETHVTRPGMVLGTVGYMSPEQASARALDFRSDQFSLGVILYEMTTGKRAFQRDTAAQTLAAIIQDEPAPIASLNPRTPASLRWIVERCLAKDPEERYASTLDLARDLAGARDRLSAGESTPESLPVRARATRRQWMPATIVAVLLLSAAAVGWRLRQRDYFWKNPLEGARFTRFTDWEGSEVDAALSPDGKFVAFWADRDGPFSVWVGQVGGGAFLNLTRGQYPRGPGSIRNIGFLDDGAHVFFSVADPANPRNLGLTLVPTIGGPPRPFLKSAMEATWAPDLTRLLYHTTAPGDPIFIADRSGGSPRQIFVDKPGFHNHFPVVSPDGRFVYVARGVPPNDMDVWRIPASGGEPERLTSHHADVAYLCFLEDGTLLYRSAREDGTAGLFAMDPERRIPHPVTLGLEEYLSIMSSADGRRLVATVANPIRSLWTVPISDRIVDEADITRFPLPSVRVGAPRFGPGYLVYLSSRSGPDGLWKFKDGSEGELWRGWDGNVIAAPAVSPDGSRIAFVVGSQAHGFLQVITSDGTGVQRIAEALDVDDAPSWSPDGKWLAVAVTEGNHHPLYKVPLDGGAPVRLVDGVDAVITDPVWSPDGSVIVYSESKGSGQVSLRGVTAAGKPFPLPEVQVAYMGNRYRFLPDGKGLVVMLGQPEAHDFSLLELASGRLRPLTRLKPGLTMKSFDVSPDGKQILFDRVRQNADVVLIDLAR
ncbi:MAG TPA: protein kinase [Vicinamibacteria bacterium]|nr:protein kinase [Vicinamibacteria bacterium]